MNAIVTGASRGLGKSLAEFLAAKGFNLHLIATNSKLLNEVKTELENKHGTLVSVYSCDFTIESQVQQLQVDLKSQISSLDILINNTGAFEFGNVEEPNLTQLKKLLDINVLGAYSISSVFIPLFKKQKKGHIFNIGSIVTEIPREDVSAYTISKFALKGFTEVLRKELVSYQVKVTELIPGSINTSSWDGVENVPKDEFIQTKELVDAIWLCYNNTAASNIESITIRPLNRDF